MEQVVGALPIGDSNMPLLQHGKGHQHARPAGDLLVCPVTNGRAAMAKHCTCR